MLGLPGIEEERRRQSGIAEAMAVIASHFEPLRHPELTSRLRKVLKRGRITAISLPLTPEIRLYLLDADYPRHALSREETEALMDDPPLLVLLLVLLLVQRAGSCPMDFGAQRSGGGPPGP